MRIHTSNIDPDELAKLKELLESQGMTLSGWFRRMMREYLEREEGEK